MLFETSLGAFSSVEELIALIEEEANFSDTFINEESGSLDIPEFDELYDLFCNEFSEEESEKYWKMLDEYNGDYSIDIDENPDTYEEYLRVVFG